MKKNRLILIGGVILFAGLSYLLFQVALSNAVSLVEVPFANKTIYPHQKIMEADIEMRKIPSYYVDEMVEVDKDKIIGQHVDLQSKLVTGMLFYKHMLITKAAVEDLPMLLLKPNQSAYAYASDLYKSLGNSLEINQKVDLYVTFVDKENKKIYVDCLIQSVRIIGIKDRSGLSISDINAKSVPSVIVLAINSEYIDLVRKASKLGTIDLSAPYVEYMDEDESLLNEECRILSFLYDDE